MAWHRPGNKPLFEPMMVILSTHICVTRPQRVKQCGAQARHAGRFDCLMSSLILKTMDNVRGHCAVLKWKVPNPTHREIENWKIYAIKQINICAEYRDLLPKASAGLSLGYNYIPLLYVDVIIYPYTNANVSLASGKVPQGYVSPQTEM